MWMAAIISLTHALNPKPGRSTVAIPHGSFSYSLLRVKWALLFWALLFLVIPKNKRDP